MPDHKTQYPLRRHETQKYYRTNETEKVRIVDFGDTLTEVLKAARKEQLKTGCSMANYITAITTKKCM